MDKFRISPSTIKQYWQYKDGDMCGLYFKANCIDRTIPKTPYAEQTEAILYGYRFEYLMSGGLPRGFKTPPPEMLTPGGKVSAKEGHLQAHLKVAKEWMKEHVGKYESGVEITADMGNYDLKTIQDMVGEVYGEKAIVEVKTTGKLGSTTSRYDEFGWNLDVLHQKRMIMIQPACAKIAAREVLHMKDIPYYFYVVSNTNPKDSALLEVVFEEKKLAEYSDMIEDAAKEIMFENEIGFAARPEKNRCKECPLYENCGRRTHLPQIKKILVA